MLSISEQIQQRHQKSLLTKKEVAQELGVSTITIDRLRKAGKLKSKKLIGKIFFRITDIVELLEE